LKLHIHVFRANEQKGRCPRRGSKRRRRRSDHGTAAHLDLAAFASGFDDARREQIRIADEIGHEGVGRTFVQRARLADLGDAAMMHDHDQIGHGQCFRLIVGHVHHTGADAAMDPPDLGLHLFAQLLVERAEWLVHQEEPRRRDQGAGHGDALLLPAGKLARITRAEVRELHQRQHLGDALLRRLPGQVRPHAQRKADIVRHRHVRKQRIGLEHHADVPLVRRHVGDRALVDQNVAGVRRKEAGDQIERGGFARTARAEQRHERAGRHIEADAVDRCEPAIRLAELAQPDLRSAVDG
jgi:hypothetical protein